MGQVYQATDTKLNRVERIAGSFDIPFQLNRLCG